MEDKELCILLGAAPTEIHAAITAKTRTLLDMLLNKTGKLFEMPTFTYGLRGRRAGFAKLEEYTIGLNIELLFSHYDEMLNQTLPHELAHLIHHRLFPTDREWHGPRWKYVMSLLEVPAEMYHTMPVKPVRKTRKFKYFCPCGEDYKVGLNLHKKIQAGSTHYCKYCDTNLYNMDWTEVTT